jgi:hypothetical protein
MMHLLAGALGRLFLGAEEPGCASIVTDRDEDLERTVQLL